jgi:hypothetical protein
LRAADSVLHLRRNGNGDEQAQKRGWIVVRHGFTFAVLRV